MTLYVKERKRGSRRVSTEAGRLVKSDLTETWIVTSDTGEEDELDVDRVVGLPQLYSAWQGFNGNTDLGLLCVRRTIADHDQTKKLWYVDVEYSTAESDGFPSQPGDPPENWEPEIEWDTELDAEIPKIDRNGVPILTDALDPPPPESDPVHRPAATLRYTRWEFGFTIARIRDYVATVNSDNWAGLDPGQALMYRITATKHRMFSDFYWRVTYVVRVRFDDDGWKYVFNNKGPHFLSLGSPKSTLAADEPAPWKWVDSSGAIVDGPETKKVDYYDLKPFIPLLPGV